MQGGRRQARCVALQALYEIDCAGHSVGDVLTERLMDEPLPESLRPFVYQLVNGVLEHQRALDALIQQYAPEWPIDQMAIIDRNVLRMAIFEFAVSETAPLRVAINEAVELAKEFGSDHSPRFVNGVLGSLAAKESELRAAFVQQNAHPKTDADL